ncbi:MAG TPA: ABC transporter ATP-binding protein [Candidatus Binatia bacterium]|nr:ABC transporter ATP-binding protein [Candidatus Binatia bacterium]
MTDEGPILEAHGLAKRYGRRTWALTGIDLGIPRGGITALVGPNAAGKSTLIKTWVGFERPTRGGVTVAGIDPWKDRAGALGHLGYVPQSPSLYDALSVEDHLELAVQLRPGFDRDSARQRLDELGIPRDRGARSLSGGQQAQVALALALGTRAEILLLDEPLASLDPLARREFLHVLTDAVRRDGATALLSSHIVTDVEQACDRLIVLGVGRVLLHATVADALTSHRIQREGDEPVAGATPIATFAGPAGERLTLLRLAGAQPPRATPDYPTTLEEVVLGYLASGRALPGQATGEAAA